MEKLLNFEIQNKGLVERVLLERLINDTFLYQFAEKMKLPKRHGNFVTWRTILPLAMPSGPIQEGVVPSPNKTEMVEFKASVKQYGDHLTYTDILTQEAFDDLVAEYSILFGEQIPEYIDKLIRDVIIKGNNVYFAGGKTSSATVTDTITMAEINKVKTILTRQKAKTFDGSSYIWLISPEMEEDLKNQTTANGSWIDVAKYANGEKVMKGEIGKWLGFRFIVDNNITPTAEGITKSIVLGKKGYGTIELAGDSPANVSLIHQPLGSAGSADPLKQIGSVAWKLNGFGVRHLHSAALLRYECKTTSTYVDGTIDLTTHVDFSSKNPVTPTP